MKVRQAQRGRVEPFYAMELLKLANQKRAQGKHVISLCLGQPAVGAPAPVREAAAKALADKLPLGYTDANGNRELREAISAELHRRYLVNISPERVLVTTGSSAGFTALILACFAPGDQVVMTRPGYPAYRNVLNALGCEVVDLDCGPETGFQPTLEMLDALGHAPAGLIIGSPSNPTGTIIAPSQLAQLAVWCEKHGTMLISDEIYHGISFGAETASVLQFSDHQIAVGSFSKYYCMTGWRAGWVVVPTELARTVELLLGNLNLSTPTLAQIAAVQAFSEESRVELDAQVEKYRKNRDLVMNWLTRLGITKVIEPQGAFYLYPDVSHLTNNSTAWCLNLLDRINVALTPGVDFAPLHADRKTPVDGDRFVRISVASDAAEIEEAFTRLLRYS